MSGDVIKAANDAQASTDDTGETFDVRSAFLLFYRYRWILLGTLATCLVLAGAWASRQPKIYRATATLEYDPDPPRPLGRAVEDISQPASNFWSNREWYETQNRVIKSQAVAERVVRKLGLHLPENAPWEIPEGAGDLTIAEAARLLLGALEIQPVIETRLVKVSYEDRDPVRAAVIANAVVDAYISKSFDDRQGSTVSALEWLNRQLATLRSELEARELALQEFRKQHDVLSVSLDDRQNIIAKNIARYNDALTDARARRFALVARLQQLRKAFADDSIDVHLGAVSNDETVSSIREAYRVASLEREELSQRYGPEHPEMKRVEKRLAKLRTQLEKELRRILASAEADLEEATRLEEALRKALEQAHAAGHELNLQEIPYRKLERDRENTAKLYSLLLERSAQTDLNRALRLAYARVVDPAVAPKEPVRPRLRVVLFAALCLGLILGIGVVFLLRRLDQSLRGPEDVEAMGVPVLGILPTIQGDAYATPRRKRPKRVATSLVDGERDLVAHREPRSAVAECCRTIRTNLTFMTTTHPAKTLVITSAGPQEGKTTVTISLAIVLAQSGKRVLVVDTDLRRPRAHRSLGVPNGAGVTSVLVRDAEVDDVIVDTKVPQLCLLPSGPIPPNPAELLHTKAFGDLIEELTKRFDVVIFDSPPLTAVTDAAIVATQVSGCVVVAHAQRTKRQALWSSIRQLKGVNANIFGSVLNDVDLTRPGYHYGGHYYYYRRGDYYLDDDAASGNGPPGGIAGGEGQLPVQT